MLPAIGLAMRRENAALLDDPAWTGVEIDFDQASHPLRIERYLEDHEPDYVSVHALELSPASPEPPAKLFLDTLREVARENGAAAVSDHLGFTRDGNGGVGLPLFVPPPFTPTALDATCRNIDIIQEHFRGLPFYVENIAYLFRLQGTMSEAEFLAGVLARTGCGWLLDVTNLYANARNHGYDAEAFLRRVLPAAGRLQIHLSGGFFDPKAKSYIDSHSEPIPGEVWDLYRRALRLGRGKIDAVFIERDGNYPDEAGWRGELHEARRLAQEVEQLP
jgi:uncharacterized protein (UPF0276 family)